MNALKKADITRHEDEKRTLGDRAGHHKAQKHVIFWLNVFANPQAVNDEASQMGSL